MSKKIKLLIVSCALLLLCLFVSSCSSNDAYERYDDEGYNVTVKYDANGSYFGNAGQLYVTDTYNIKDSALNSNGNKEILLVDPENEIRGKANVQEIARAAMPGYFFAGWYTGKTELKVNGEVVKDDKNNTVYVYSGKWDFSKKYEIDPNKDYSASEPVVTLYAAWVRTPSVEIYNGEELVATYEIKNPTLGSNSIITAPYLDLKKGEYNFGTLKDALASGTTNRYSWVERFVENGTTNFFEGLYLDSTLETKMSEKYTHPYDYDAQTAQIDNLTLKLYINYESKAGEWYRVYSAAQLANNAKPDGNYELMADIEFSALTPWPNTFKNNDFTGTIEGNGHKMSNISIESTSGQYFGMFKSITKDAKIQNVSLENITAVIDRTYRNPGARYGIIAAIIEDGFKFDNVSVTNATLNISASSVAIITADYEVGLICAEGYSEDLGLDLDQFSYKSIETEYDLYTLNIEKKPDENGLSLEFVAKEQE